MARYPAVIQIRVSLETRQRLAELAAQHGQKESVVIRSLINGLLERVEDGDQDAVLDTLIEEAERQPISDELKAKAEQARRRHGSTRTPA